MHGMYDSLVGYHNLSDDAVYCLDCALEMYAQGTNIYGPTWLPAYAPSGDSCDNCGTPLDGETHQYISPEEHATPDRPVWRAGIDSPDIPFREMFTQAEQRHLAFLRHLRQSGKLAS